MNFSPILRNVYVEAQYDYNIGEFIYFIFRGRLNPYKADVLSRLIYEDGTKN